MLAVYESENARNSQWQVLLLEMWRGWELKLRVPHRLSTPGEGRHLQLGLATALPAFRYW